MKCAKVRTVMTLRESKDPEIRYDPPEVKSFVKWQAEVETDKAVKILEHKDIVGHTQTDNKGLGHGAFKPFNKMTPKERKGVVVREVRSQQEEARRLHLVECSHQGQCVRWEENVIPRRITWSELWKWTPARTSFLLKSVYDSLPSPSNLVRWKISDNDQCACGNAKGTLRHILTNCQWGLNKPVGDGRYLWRHDQVLKILWEAIEQRIVEINETDAPKIEIIRSKIPFIREGQKSYLKPKGKKVVVNDEWEGTWNAETDLTGNLSLPFVDSRQRPDVILYNQDRMRFIAVELTICWEDNIEEAHNRKEDRYEELLASYMEAGFDAECLTIEVGARGYIGHRLLKFLRRLGITPTKIKELCNKIQKTVENCSYWIWLKREDQLWLET